MNTVNGMAKVVMCGAAALAVTFLTVVSLVQSTDAARWVNDMPTVVIVAKAEAPALRVSQSATAGLLQ